jgi:hypothetical protein
MNPELENELELEAARLLRGLPDLAAPVGFVARTMSALERPARRGMKPWSKWPVAGRIAFLALALAAAAAGFEAWRVIEPGLWAGAARLLAPVGLGVSCFWNVLSALTGALALALEKMGKGFLLACLVAGAGACFLCAGFGTVLVRLAQSRPVKNTL